MAISRDGTTLRRPLAAALAVLMSGCSFVSVQRPRSPAAIDDPRVPDTCTTSSQAPVADTILAGAGLVAGYVALVLAVIDETNCVGTSTSSCGTGNPAPGLALFGAGALFAGSAIYGYISTAQCRHRVRASERCASGDIFSCRKLKPSWAPPPGWRSDAVLQPARPTAVPSSGMCLLEPMVPEQAPTRAGGRP